ncbi:leucyl aminopeptidase [Isosphaeraceae bacterium EP7]
MDVRIERLGPDQVDSPWLAVGVFEDQVGPPAGLEANVLGVLVGRLLESKDLGTAVGEVSLLHGDWSMPARSAALVGLGTKAAFNAGAAFSAGVALGKKLAGRKRDRIALALPGEGLAPSIISAWVEGFIVGTRGPGLHKSEPSRHEPGELIVAVPAGSLADADLTLAVERGRTVGWAMNLARDLVNTPPAEKPPHILADRAKVLAEEAGLEVEVWGEARLEDERFGGLLAVAAGSDEPPAFVRISYRKGGEDPVLALVGKGVTFDSGGLSLKPSSSMEDMKSDMTGSAVVLATVLAASKLGLKVNVDAYLAVTENMTGGRAMKLGDVLTMRNGKTVEVMNTDAEGRLILADALSYVAEQKPARVIDLATLTGACMVALGTKYAGLFSNDDALANDVLAASKATGERAWRLPLDEDFKELFKSPVADLKNVGGKWGGAITAAKFLEQFVGGVPWVHLDIAGPSWADNDSATRDCGGTGCFVRTLVTLLETSAKG